MTLISGQGSEPARSTPPPKRRESLTPSACGTGRGEVKEKMTVYPLEGDPPGRERCGFCQSGRRCLVAMEGDREKCMMAGCSDYATKPIDRKKLVDTVLKCIEEHKSNPDAARTPTPPELSLAGCRVLFADENPMNRVLVAGVLEGAGAELTVVGGGKPAVDAAVAARDEGRPFDVVLMDIRMALMGGEEATEALRSRGYKGKIIALAAGARNEDHAWCIDHGFDDIAWKPVNRTKLLKTIRHHWATAEAMPASAT